VRTIDKKKEILGEHAGERRSSSCRWCEERRHMAWLTSLSYQTLSAQKIAGYIWWCYNIDMLILGLMRSIRMLRC
jgi:hypothetical protein